MTGKCRVCGKEESGLISDLPCNLSCQIKEIQGIKMTKFSIKIIDDTANKTKNFRLLLGERVVGMGNADTLKSMDDENLGTFLTMILNEALNILWKEVDARLHKLRADAEVDPMKYDPKSGWRD